MGSNPIVTVVHGGVPPTPTTGDKPESKREEPTLRWKIIYLDGSTFSHVDGEPQDAPGGGVLAVVQEDSTVGLLIHEGENFYVFDKQYGGWQGMDVFGFVQYIVRPGLKIIKLGESMTTDRYMKIITDARRDPNLPKKSARYPWEVKP